MNHRARVLRRYFRAGCTVILVLSMLSLSSCSGNVGVGVSVGVPVGNHGFMSVGTSRWY
ncbi:MAG TPA: hypothetical protein VKB34_07835 [Povalibacter sp.]|nr:hypothetical protein [Povalibacter sp.]